MSTSIFLSNDTSDVSGFLTAYVGTRSPLASATSVSVASTTSVAGSGTTAMTLTAGGAAAKWITKPLGVATTINTAPFANWWVFQVAQTANAFVDLQLLRFSGGSIAGAAFLTSSLTTSATPPPTTATRSAYLATTGIALTAMTSQPFNVNDRLVILPIIDSNSQGVQAAGTVRFDYNGSVEGSDGDAFVIFDQDLQVTTTQGPKMNKAPSLQHLENIRVEVSALSNFAGQMYSPDAKLEAVLNELAAQRDTEGA